MQQRLIILRSRLIVATPYVLLHDPPLTHTNRHWRVCDVYKTYMYTKHTCKQHIHVYQCAIVCLHCHCMSALCARSYVNTRMQYCMYALCVRTYVNTRTQDMGWLRIVGSFKLYVSFAEYSLFYRALLQQRLILYVCTMCAYAYELTYTTHVLSRDNSVIRHVLLRHVLLACLIKTRRIYVLSRDNTCLITSHVFLRNHPFTHTTRHWSVCTHARGFFLDVWCGPQFQGATVYCAFLDPQGHCAGSPCVSAS